MPRTRKEFSITHKIRLLAGQAGLDISGQISIRQFRSLMRARIPDRKELVVLPDYYEIPLPNPNRVRLPLSELFHRTYVHAHSTASLSILDLRSSILNS